MKDLVRILQLLACVSILLLNSCESEIAGGPSSERFSQAPADRPGLATKWGETRRCRINVVGFERAASEPVAVSAIHYNDEIGIRAMTAYAPRNQGGRSCLGRLKT